ncbi:elongation factor P [Candidatus Dependentiae bacterium]|nr:elongation factor P [Candidatus Dependentiae bacterium]
MIQVTELRQGKVVKINNQLYSVVKISFNQPKEARTEVIYRVKFQNLSNHSILEKSFHSPDKLDDVYLEVRKMQYLYNDSEFYTFMDIENYEQYQLDKRLIGDAVYYLLENMEVVICLYDGQPVTITMPNFVVLNVVYTEPGERGDTTGKVLKPAKLETGLEVQVPLFVDNDTKIKVDTRTGEYVSRA